MRKLAALRERRLPREIRTKAFREAYEGLPEGDSIKWLIGSMQPISPEYTRETIKQAERVKSHLETDLSAMGTNAQFEYQGSVTNDTHIKAYSDIDLLVLHPEITQDDIKMPGTGYDGDVILELINLRLRSAQVVRSRFPGVEVDYAGGKSVALTGGSLTRKVDLVTCHWWNTFEFIARRRKQDRGIRVLDITRNNTVGNKPFLHNAHVEEKDNVVNGKLRKAARLLKSLKYDADTEVDLSSYDIVAICFNMPNDLLAVPEGADPLLAKNCSKFLDRLEQDSRYRDEIHVPNRMRRVFCAEGACVAGLRQLNKELKQLLSEVEAELTRSFRKLIEARIRL